MPSSPLLTVSDLYGSYSPETKATPGPLYPVDQVKYAMVSGVIRYCGDIRKDKFVAVASPEDGTGVAAMGTSSAPAGT